MARKKVHLKASDGTKLKLWPDHALRLLAGKFKTSITYVIEDEDYEFTKDEFGAKLVTPSGTEYTLPENQTCC